MAAPDTSASVTRIQADLFLRMTSGEKSTMVEQMSDESRELARCGIRERRPGYSPDEVEHALHRLLVGGSVASSIYGEPRTTRDIDIVMLSAQRSERSRPDYLSITSASGCCLTGRASSTSPAASCPYCSS